MPPSRLTPLLGLCLLLSLPTPSLASASPTRWSPEKAQSWYEAQPWLFGANFLPSNAINQLEMWQAETFDPLCLDRELGWAAGLGMNTLRVFLHDLLWEADAEGLYARMDQFLTLCAKHGLRPSFVFFDDCHFTTAKLGPQPLPVPAYHNSGWVTSPERAVALRYATGQSDPKEKARLHGYVAETIRRFGSDPRVLYWELYNEPGRGPGLPDKTSGRSTEMADLSSQLLKDSFAWAREAAPSQPVCATGEGAVGTENIRLAYASSDILSFHCYGDAQEMERQIATLRREQPGRPLLCTEWLARTRGSLVQTVLPVLHRERVAALTWGLVAGKSGTIWPWSSHEGVDAARLRSKGRVVAPGQPLPEPALWFHDLLRSDGTAFDPEELALCRELSSRR